MGEWIIGGIATQSYLVREGFLEKYSDRMRMSLEEEMRRNRTGKDPATRERKHIPITIPKKDGRVMRRSQR